MAKIFLNHPIEKRKKKLSFKHSEFDSNPDTRKKEKEKKIKMKGDRANDTCNKPYAFSFHGN